MKRLHLEIAERKREFFRRNDLQIHFMECAGSRTRSDAGGPDEGCQIGSPNEHTGKADVVDFGKMLAYEGEPDAVRGICVRIFITDRNREVVLHAIDQGDVLAKAR